MNKLPSLLSFLNSISSVILVCNDTLDTKPIITPLLNPNQMPKTDLMGNELGSIRLEQESSSLNGSFLNSRKRVAFVTGTLEDLNKRVKMFDLKHGSELPGKIVIFESLEPMWNGQTPKINPQKDDEIIGVNVGDKFYPVYAQMKYTDDETLRDRLIRTPEDVNAWYAVRQGLKLNNAVAGPVKEEAGIPVAQ